MKEIRLLTRTYIFKLFPVVLFMMFVSCIKEDELLPDYIPVEVTFSADATRATDATWTANDAVGVYVLPAGGTALSAATVSNRKYIVATNGTMTLAEGSAIYYPINGDGIRFMAYYPYGTVTSYTRTFTFTDQSTQAKKEAVDFCFHRGTTNYSRTSPASSLAFTHKFSKILMTVKQGTGGPDVSNVAVTLSSMPTSATVNLATMATTDASAITNSGTGTITAYTHTGGTATQATVEAIIAPHSGTTGRVITFTTSDKARTYTLDSSLAFEAGKVYSFDVTLESSVVVFGDGGVNCFIVPPNATLTFAVTQAYTTKTGTTLRVDNATYTGSLGAAVVWSDAAVINSVSVSGTGNKSQVIVKTTGVTGNAVVKIYKGSDATAIVWSYHIWVTDYDPTAKTWTNNGFTFMDRNLGATTAGLTVAARGLFYQWGRKDPFPRTGTVTTVATSSSNGTVAYSIKNPATFITAASSPYDWHYASRDNTLLGHGTTKSVYDPCPLGWRVPVNSNMSSAKSPWYGVSAQSFTSGTGVNWGTNALYPAAGCRDYSAGALYEVGRNGGYRSASPYSSSSGSTSSLFFSYDGSLNVDGNHYRADGFSVRCVKE
jgi:hypothetical protein